MRHMFLSSDAGTRFFNLEKRGPLHSNKNVSNRIEEGRFDTLISVRSVPLKKRFKKNYQKCVQESKIFCHLLKVHKNENFFGSDFKIFTYLQLV